MEVKKKFSLKRHNTFGIDCTADTLIVLNNNNDYLDLLSSDYLSISNRLILGGGSNILFLSDFRGVVIRPANEELNVIEENQDSVIIKAGAGINWDNFVAACIANGWHGLENLSDIPGLIGAAPIQNIGAYGVEVKDFIDSVEGFLLNDKKPVIFSNKECLFNYRDSIFKNELKGNILISGVTFKLSKFPILNTSYDRVEEEFNLLGIKNSSMLRQAIKNIRREKLPLPEQQGNAGSFFKNPIVDRSVFERLEIENSNIPHYQHNDKVKIPAAWLIDKAGLKGFTKGKAGTHPVQPLVIINKGDAKGKDIYDFSSYIIDTVKNKFNILLEREVNVI